MKQLSEGDVWLCVLELFLRVEEFQCRYCTVCMCPEVCVDGLVF